MVSGTPRVTIGVPVRNGGRTLRRTLQNIVDQTHQNLEVIVSDNCSSDDTTEIAQEMAARDSRFRYVRQPRPLTGWGNFQYLVRAAQGDYFMWAAATTCATTATQRTWWERSSPIPARSWRSVRW